MDLTTSSIKTLGAENYIANLKEAQEDAKSALALTAKRMKYFYDRKASKIPKYTIGEKAWLSTKNLRLQQLARKFSVE
jgi:hypothetical protein